MTVYDSLTGQGDVVTLLRAAASGDGMTHAWLFTGPPGSGRSVAARAFATALLCADGGCGTCASCHQNEKFIGKEFVDNWGDRRVGDFYTLIRNTMPVDNPGGLKEQEYLDVTAYLLKANHAEPKGDSLSTDTTVMRGRKISVRNP